MNIVLNNYSKTYLKEISDSQIKVIPNFIDVFFLKDIPKEICQSLKNVCYIGHVIEKKGILKIAEIAKLNPDISFTIAGPIYMDVGKYNFSDNVLFLGSLNSSEVRNLLKNTDLFLFLTKTEGFSNSLLEAMAMGVPIITTDVGANYEMLENKGGFIVPIQHGKVQQNDDKSNNKI